MGGCAGIGRLSAVSEADTEALHVRELGSGPPVVLVHGWPFDHRIFSPQIRPLSRDFRVIAYDRRGFGRSTGDPSLARDVADIAALLSERGIESAHILGMSQGGRIALRFAAQHPHMARSLVLQAPAVDGFTPISGSDAIPLGRYAAWAARGEMQRVREAWLRHPMVASGIEAEETFELLTTLLADYQGRDLVDFDTRNPEYAVDVAAAVAAAQIPVIILTGALETPARREHADHLLRVVPGARELVLEHSGHLSNLTEPARFNEAVRDFCWQVERSRDPSLDGAHD